MSGVNAYVGRVSFHVNSRKTAQKSRPFRPAAFVVHETGVRSATITASNGVAKGAPRVAPPRFTSSTGQGAIESWQSGSPITAVRQHDAARTLEPFPDDHAALEVRRRFGTRHHLIAVGWVERARYEHGGATVHSGDTQG